MTTQTPRNIGVSIRQRLLNKARQEQRPFAELLQYFAMERFLYRLSQSSHSNTFLLKGALMLRAWKFPLARATMDIDMLGRESSNAIDIVIGQVRDICTTLVQPDDGLTFDDKSIVAERITEDADYHGVRVRFIGKLDTARINMQLDIGFGDIVVPGPQRISLPSLLDFPAPDLQGYSIESAIAEKFEAMVKLGELNSRMKDFYDIWMLARQFNFDEENLCLAIEKTLRQRGTDLPEQIPAFSDQFAQIKSQQWKAFRKRLGQTDSPENFEVVISLIREFLTPIVKHLRSKHHEAGVWVAPGPWRKYAQ
jgi:predicted nucleotidyltransferase component of viral defense system